MKQQITKRPTSVWCDNPAALMRHFCRTDETGYSTARHNQAMRLQCSTVQCSTVLRRCTVQSLTVLDIALPRVKAMVCSFSQARVAVTGFIFTAKMSHQCGKIVALHRDRTFGDLLFHGRNLKAISWLD